MTMRDQMGEYPKVAATRAELAHEVQAASGRSRALVMTMGALHEGHGELMRAARETVGGDGHVTVSIFVNPTQFGVNEDLDNYPRTFDSDLELCYSMGVNMVFAPTAEEIYPAGPGQITISPGPLGSLYEGAARPGHFAGVLTVVGKFILLSNPHYAMFGEKDYQQLTLVRQMVHDLNFGVEVVAVPTVRAADGLALSSRNKYLDPQARDRALSISRAIAVAQAAAADGAGADLIAAAATSILERVTGLEIEYVAVTDPMMGPAPESGEGRIIITAIVGGTRLLDNARVDIGS